MSEEGTAPATARLAEGELTISSSGAMLITLESSTLIHTKD